METEEEDPELLKMNDRVRDSMVFVDTLVEFRVLLEELDLPKKVVLDYLEHENAHMNVAEQESSFQVNPQYGVMLLAYKGEWFAASPMVMTEKHIEVPMKDFLESAIRTTKAPADYGHSLSETDKANIARYQSILAKKNKSQ